MAKKTKSLEALNSTIFTLWQQATGGNIETLVSVTVLPNLTDMFPRPRNSQSTTLLGKKRILAKHAESLLNGKLSYKHSNKTAIYVYTNTDDYTQSAENSYLWTQWTQKLASELRQGKESCKCDPNKWEVTEEPTNDLHPTFTLTRLASGCKVRKAETHTLTGEGITDIENEIKTILGAYYAS